MEALEDSNSHSLTDSFSLYERYMRSFNIINNFVEEHHQVQEQPLTETPNSEYESSYEANVDLTANKPCELAEKDCDPTACLGDKLSADLDADICLKTEDSNQCGSSVASLDNSSATAHSLLTDKSYNTDVPVSSEDSKPDFKQPTFITFTMENSNNAVDSVPLFRDVRPSESIFKLPIRELSFNGTLKHVQKLKPIVDPITAMSSNAGLVNIDDKSLDQLIDANSTYLGINVEERCVPDQALESSTSSERVDKGSESTGDSQFDNCSKKECNAPFTDEGSSKWNAEQSYSSLEASFDSGVRSPDMFSDEDEANPATEPFWGFLKDFEAYDKRRVRKIEETLRGLLPPPSVTTLKTDVTEMLKKYYCFLPAFNDSKVSPEANSTTPSKRVSFVQIPTDTETLQRSIQEPLDVSLKCTSTADNLKGSSLSRDDAKSQLESSADKSIDIKICTEIEARETFWPDILKCRYYDVYYNRSHYSERYELLSLKFGERYIGAETDTSVNVYSGGLQSPSSASKRKAQRIKIAQMKSPGRRLSHLARRRQAFCSAATINEKAHASSSKMFLIDRKKLISNAERKSPRTRRTPGKKTPVRKTPGKKTPSKTPKSSSKKKAMRRLLMDSENITRSQPPREAMIKRALFISPENRKSVPQAASTSVPAHAMKSKRALFGSPVTADTKSSDGTQSDQFLKRKRDALGDVPETSRNKIAKSLSFGGDSIRGGTSQSQPNNFARRASEVFATKNSVELNENHKKKLLWAVSEALRVHGWRMSSPGFREKASSLARLTRRLLALPPHAARLAAPHLSTSDTMLKLARQYVFAIIQGRSVEECYHEEQTKLSNESSNKVTGYISASAYQQLKQKQAPSALTSQVKENCSDGSVKQDQPRSNSKNVLQDKLVNIDSNSNSSSSGLSLNDKTAMFKSNSMPSFEEAAKMRARRQISFDNVDFPKR